MGQQQSKHELLYQQVNYGNVEGIKALCREGANIEWTDREGKTPLIAACLNPDLFDVAKTLIELGANVNAYRTGQHNGTPLHHAAKRGIDRTVNLLLTHGANALLLNDDCQTPLEVARAKGYNTVVCIIENHISLFSGWMREFSGPGFLEVLAPTLVSKKVWVVITPCGSRNPTRPFKLELSIYSSLQDAQPRLILALWKANMEEPNFHQTDPAVVLTHMSTKTRFKLGPAKVGDKRQLEWFCNACKGIPQAMHPLLLNSIQAPVISATAPPVPPDYDFSIPVNAHGQSTALPFTSASTATSSNAPSNPSNYYVAPSKGGNSDWAGHEAGPSAIPTEHIREENKNLVASSPLVPDDSVDTGPVQYPTIDFSPIPADEMLSSGAGENKKKEDSSCVICLDAPVEGACIPCGHMAGCMMCLNEIKTKNWGCPVCRAKIDQVVRLYAV
uniref:RING-type domain-containing protein n=1 Tax=Kalanchoe fedtschenkoi TaxID=63787 RepID=A0A7N0ZZE9_KALFE